MVLITVSSHKDASVSAAAFVSAFTPDLTSVEIAWPVIGDFLSVYKSEFPFVSAYEVISVLAEALD